MSPEVIRTSEDPDKPGAIPMQTWLLSLSEEEVRQLVHGGELDRIMGDILKNIAEFHHESVNGKGYPYGRSGDAIPLEARIAAVADVFDALTSKRPYKEAWSNEEAIAALNTMADEKLDRDCVNALIRHLDEVREIQQRFEEDLFG